MKKFHFTARLGSVFMLLVAGGLFVSSMFAVNQVFAASDDELVEEFEDLEESEHFKDAKELEKKLDFEQFSTCEDMQTVLGDFLDENKEYFARRGGYYPMYGRDGDDVMMAEDQAVSEEAAPDGRGGGVGGGTVDSSSTAFSETNIQVEGVDEPDILKTDGDYLYYYNQGEQKIMIVRSPLDRADASITLSDAEVVSTINIPERFSNIQLFLRNDRLVILGQRWRDRPVDGSFINSNSRVDIVTYNVSDVTDPKLERFTDLDGSYKDARLIDNQLYVITQLHVNWGGLWAWYDQNGVVPVDGILPKNVDVAYQDEGDKPLMIDGKEYPYGVSVNKTDCNSILYVLPSSESLENTNLMPSFSIVRKVDITDPQEDVQSTTAFGSTQEVHMTEESLYLSNPMYFQDPVICPEDMLCTMPRFWGGETNTLIHKFSRNNTRLVYEDSSLVAGSPLTQWSMSEDRQGNFRIITETRMPNLNTHLFVLDEDLSVIGMVRNIQENEEFKASRFIGDKLYLVTFERVDPLFVIDIADPDDPEIVGELKIPGYSTYLHPYTQAEDGVQYLIGIGYDTAESNWGGIVNAGFKTDLYKVDYTQEDEDGMIAVSQEHTLTLGQQGSRSEAIENPRMFVWNEDTQTLVVPLILQDQEKEQHCNVQYNSAGEEISRNCWDSYTNYTTFAGMKALHIDTEEGIQESESYDYKEILPKRDYGRFVEEPMPVDGESSVGSAGSTEDTVVERENYIDQWQFRQLMMRVGYLGDVLYSLNNKFAHFVIPDTSDEKFIDWSEEK